MGYIMLLLIESSSLLVLKDEITVRAHTVNILASQDCTWPAFLGYHLSHT